MKISRWLIPLSILLTFTTTLVYSDPEPSIGARMIYDPVDQRILMYGGADWENGYTFFDELWSYEPETNI